MRTMLAYSSRRVWLPLTPALSPLTRGEGVFFDLLCAGRSLRVEGIGPFKLTNIRSMRYHAGRRSPGVNIVRGWFHDEGLGRIGREIERDLVRGARRRARDGAGEARLDRAMQVAAQDAFDLRMLRHDLRERVRCGKPDLVHERDVSGKRRMMHEQQRRPLRRGGERQGE